MLKPASPPRGARLWLAPLGLALALLACARAEVPFSPGQPQVSTPMLAVARVDGAPTETPDAAEPVPTALPTESVGGYPPPADGAATGAGYPGPTAEAPTPTLVIQQPPTDTPPPTETPLATDTPAPTETSVPATDTPAPTATPEPSATVGPTQPPAPQPIPPEAQFIQTLTVSHDGGVLVGRPQDMLDGRETTWASLRGGSAAWVLDLGALQNVAGVRLYAQRDGSDPTTLTKIDISPDGSNWATVYTGAGNCGVPACDTLVQLDYTDLGFGTFRAQYVRVIGGPTRFAFGEVFVAVLP